MINNRKTLIDNFYVSDEILIENTKSMKIKEVYLEISEIIREINHHKDNIKSKFPLLQKDDFFCHISKVFKNNDEKLTQFEKAILTFDIPNKFEISKLFFIIRKFRKWTIEMKTLEKIKNNIIEKKILLCIEKFDIEISYIESYFIKNDMATFCKSIGLFEFGNNLNTAMSCSRFIGSPRVKILKKISEYDIDPFESIGFDNKSIISISFENNCYFHIHLLLSKYLEKKKYGLITLNNKLKNSQNLLLLLAIKNKISKISKYINSLKTIASNNSSLKYCFFVKKLINDREIQKIFNLQKDIVSEINISIAKII